jgi:hypothetical protein
VAGGVPGDLVRARGGEERELRSGDPQGSPLQPSGRVPGASTLRPPAPVKHASMKANTWAARSAPSRWVALVTVIACVAMNLGSASHGTR